MNYDRRNWESIAKFLDTNNYKRIHVLNRQQLLNDALAFVKAGLMGIDIVMDLTVYLYRENDPSVWHSALETVSYLLAKFRHNRQYALLKVNIDKSKFQFDS